MIKRIIGLFIAIFIAVAIIPDTRDEIYWIWASRENKISSYQVYLKNWPFGNHRREAQARHDELRWAAAKLSNTVRAYQDYNTTYPIGGHFQESKNKIDILRKIDMPYQAAMNAGTENSLRKFLEDFPGHQKEHVIRQAIQDITEGKDILDMLKEKK